MEHNVLKAKMQRGQISIEFILIIVIMLAYLELIIVPNITISTQSVEDVMQVGNASFAAKKLINTINAINSLGGEAKQTITLFIPKESYLDCSNQNIAFSTKLNDKLAPVEICKTDNDGTEVTDKDKRCTKSVQIPNFTACDLGSGATKVDGPKTIKVAIIKDSGGNISVTKVS